MNAALPKTSRFLAATAQVDAAAIQPLPNSRKVYVEGSRPDIQVPMREISQADTPTAMGGEKNPPIYVYDCSGPYTDPTAKIDIRQGLPALRQTWIEERGDTPYIWLARGDVLLARAETRANFCFEKALLLAPRDWFVAWLAARIRCFHEQFALALKLLQKALELNAGHFLLWLEMGKCQQALGLIGPACNSFTQARQLNPRCDDAGSALAKLSSAGIGPRMRGWWRRLFNR